MSFISRNWIRLTCLVGCGVVLAGVAVVRSMLVDPPGNNSPVETPRIADILTMEGGGFRTVQIRDQPAIVVLQSILEGGSEFEGAVSGTAPHQVFIHPTDKKTYSYTPSRIWRIGDDFVWQNAGKKTVLNGSLTDFLEWLRIRRCNQLRRDANPTVRRRGQELQKAMLSEGRKTLIRIANSNNHWFAEAGIREITEFLSAEPPTITVGIPGEPFAPPRRKVLDRDHLVHDALLKILKDGPSISVGQSALHCLKATGGRSTGNELATLLNQHKGGPLGDQLLTAVEGLYGIPLTYERFGICGNSTEEELAKFAREEAARQEAAIKDLLAWQRDHAQDSDEEFYDAVVLRWTEMLIHIADTPDQNYSYLDDQTPAPKLANLLGNGGGIVPALKRRKSAVKEGWQERAMLEFAIAFLTAECDTALVKELLVGSKKQQRIGCSIIAAAGDTTFDKELLKLLRIPLGDSDVHESVAVRSVAAQALFRSKGVEALPDLRAAMKAGYDSPMLQQIQVHLEVPVAQF